MVAALELPGHDAGVFSSSKAATESIIRAQLLDMVATRSFMLSTEILYSTNVVIVATPTPTNSKESNSFKDDLLPIIYTSLDEKWISQVTVT